MDKQIFLNYKNEKFRYFEYFRTIHTRHGEHQQCTVVRVPFFAQLAGQNVRMTVADQQHCAIPTTL